MKEPEQILKGLYGFLSNFDPLYLHRELQFRPFLWNEVGSFIKIRHHVSTFYGFVNLRVIFNNTCRVKSFFPYKDRFSRSQRSKVVYKAGCWDCDSFYVGKTKRRLHDKKTEHFKALTQDCHASALADHVISTGHNIKWDHFEIIAAGKSDLQCKIKETLLISELKPSLNENVGSEKLFLY